MFRKHVITGMLALFVACAIFGFTRTGSYAGPQAAAVEGPPLGKWEFIGKDNHGAEWKGTLTIGKLDTTFSDGVEYHAICEFEMKSADSENGISAPFRWDPGKREFSLKVSTAEYTAVLSADGKSLTRGKFAHWNKNYRTRKSTLRISGTWSAKFIAP